MAVECRLSSSLAPAENKLPPPYATTSLTRSHNFFARRLCIVRPFERTADGDRQVALRFVLVVLQVVLVASAGRFGIFQRELHKPFAQR